MRVLVTGGAGYVGTELVYALAANDKVEEVIVYDNLSRKNYNLFIGRQKFGAKVTFIEGDILDSRKVAKILDGVSVVYHLAAKVTTPFADQNAHLFEQVNHWGTADLSYNIEHSKVEKVFYLSSVSVYGSGSKEVDVDAPLNPRTFYGISKMRGEEHMLRLADRVSTSVIRCGNIYGYSKSMRFDAVINKFLFDANFNGKITVHGDGRQNRAFIHIDRAAEALSGLLTSSLEPGIFNLVERNMLIQELLDHFQEVFPKLEMLFVNQHLKLREIRVKPDERINGLIKSEQKSFVQEMIDFKSHFTF